MKKVMALIIANVMLFTLLAGCGQEESEAVVPGSNAPAVSDNSGSGNDDNGGGGSNDAALEITAEPVYANNFARELDIPNSMLQYPLPGGGNVSWFFPVDAFIGIGCTNFNEHPVMIEWQKQTGIDIAFVSPPIGEFDTRFNLMVATNDWTDIVTWADAYTGNMTAGIADGVYYELSELSAKNSPNYEYFRKANEDRRRSTMNDMGQLTAYYGLMPYNESMWFGFLIKQEALDKTGLPIPETIGEWEEFLVACKEQGYSSPFAWRMDPVSSVCWTGGFNAAYGMVSDWCTLDENGKVTWTPFAPGAKDYLALMRKWMEMGLIDKEYASRDWPGFVGYLQSDDVAATIESPDTMFGVWKTDLGLDFVGANNPVINKGDKPYTGYKHFGNAGWATTITTGAEDPDLCAKLLNFGYSWEGYLISSFGLPGENCDIDENGKPYYPDWSPMWDPNDETPLGNRVWKYKLHSGPFINDQHNSNPTMVMEGTYSPQIRFAWTDAMDNSRVLPGLSFLPEEASREAELGSMFSTMRNETFTKIVYGELPLDAYDDFVEQVKANGYDEFISIWQGAYERYLNR